MQQWLHTAAGQAAAEQASRLDLSADEVAQFYHTRMLQSLGRLRIDGGQEAHHEAPISAEGVQMAAGELPEEAEAAISRLTTLGFSRSQARP